MIQILQFDFLSAYGGKCLPKTDIHLLFSKVLTKSSKIHTTKRKSPNEASSQNQHNISIHMLPPAPQLRSH